MNYEQAYKDWEYLWNIAPADDMTGGYVDQEDLAKMLRNPNKRQATKCLVSQIEYWFQKGPDPRDTRGASYDDLCTMYPELPAIYERYSPSFHF